MNANKEWRQESLKKFLKFITGEYDN